MKTQRFTENDLRALVVVIAKRFLGTPYRHMGRSTGGMDCVHLPLECFERAGIVPHIEVAQYPEDWAMHRDDQRYVREMEAIGMRKITRDPKPADMAMYNWGRCVSHGALVIEWPLVIHAYKPARKVVLADASQGALVSRFAGFWSFWD